MTSTQGMIASIRNVLDMSMPSTTNGNTNQAPELMVTGEHNTTTDLNEDTSLYEEGATTPDLDATADTTPPAYERIHRDSGVSVSSESCESSSTLPVGGDKLPQSRFLARGRPVPAMLSLKNDDGRVKSLGPSMDQWRLEEEEEARMAKRSGKAIPSLTPPLSPRPLSERPMRSPRPSFGQEEGRRPSIGPAMDQWRLEEEEELKMAKNSGKVIPALLSPVSPRLLSAHPSRSSFGQDEGRRPSIGPAMDQWRLEEEEELKTAKSNGKPVPDLLSPEASRPLSRRGLRSPRSSFGQEDGRRPSLGPSMDQWRLEEEEELRAAKSSGKAIPELLSPARRRPLAEWSSRSPRSSFGQEDLKRSSIGAAMEQWRLEELEASKNDGPIGIAPSPAPVTAPASSTAVPPTVPGKAQKIMSIGHAMEAWRKEDEEW